ncbi:MAG TPA: FAD:protein FMN transferase [Pirellulales bacterium]|jgi:thiamine biosynthesis lipoprotein|nr:FAD:protein FMN transferase [Pirellulales bacterium]
MMRIDARLPTSVGVWLAVACALGADASESAAAELEGYRYQQVHMGMPVEVVLYAPDSAAANKAADAAFARFHQLDAVLSDYNPASELSRLSASAGSRRAVPLSDDLWTVLVHAQQLAAATEGAFDVTVGPATKLWRRARREREFPSAERLAEARAAIGYQALVLDELSHKATLTRPGMRLDVGGIAAGYAVDEALRVLREHGITRAMVDASGDIGVGDAPPGKRGWTLGVVPEGGRDNKPLRYLLLANAAVTTSGDAFQHVEFNGQRYSHIVDPHTSLGLSTRCSATVIAPDCITADSLATAVCVLGPEKGIDFIEHHSNTAALITTATDGPARLIESSRFGRFAAATGVPGTK